VKEKQLTALAMTKHVSSMSLRQYYRTGINADAGLTPRSNKTTNAGPTFFWQLNF
jgi:hypothetical protein